MSFSALATLKRVNLCIYAPRVCPRYCQWTGLTYPLDGRHIETPPPPRLHFPSETSLGKLRARDAPTGLLRPSFHFPSHQRPGEYSTFSPPPTTSSPICNLTGKVPRQGFAHRSLFCPAPFPPLMQTQLNPSLLPELSPRTSRTCKMNYCRL